MFAPATVCTRCLGKRTDSRYRTCNKCMSRTRAHQQIQQQPENTIPSNPPPNFNPLRNSTGLRPLAPANPPQTFEPNIPENTIPSNPPPDFNPLQNSINRIPQ